MNTIFYAVSDAVPVADHEGKPFVFPRRTDGQLVLVIHPFNAALLEDTEDTLFCRIGEYELLVSWPFHVSLCALRWN